MDYDINGSPNKKEITFLSIFLSMIFLNIFSEVSLRDIILNIISDIGSDENKQLLLFVFSSVFLGFMTFFVFLELVVRERTKSLTEFFVGFLKIKDEAYREYSFNLIFGLCSIFKYLTEDDYEKEIKNKLIPGMSDSKPDSETTRHKYTFDRLKEIYQLFRNALLFTSILIIISLSGIFLTIVFINSILVIILISAAIIFSSLSLFYGLKLVYKLIWGDKKDREYILNALGKVINLDKKVSKDKIKNKGDR